MGLNQIEFIAPAVLSTEYSILLALSHENVRMSSIEAAAKPGYFTFSQVPVYSKVPCRPRTLRPKGTMNLAC